jgi:hypothetical protein
MNDDELGQALEARASRTTPGGADAVLGAAHAGSVIDGPRRGRRGWLAAAAVVAVVGGVAGSAIFDDPAEDEEVATVAADGRGDSESAERADAGSLIREPAPETFTVQDIEDDPITRTTSDVADVPPSEVVVLISFVASREELAASMVNTLQLQGYDVTALLDETRVSEGSGIIYLADYEGNAHTIAGQLPTDLQLIEARSLEIFEVYGRPGAHLALVLGIERSGGQIGDRAPPILHPSNEVRVLVTNGTAVAGAASRASDTLTAGAGYETLIPSNTVEKIADSRAYYVDGYELDARLIAKTLGFAPESILRLSEDEAPVADLGDAHVVVVLGADWPGL